MDLYRDPGIAWERIKKYVDVPPTLLEAEKKAREYMDLAKEAEEKWKIDEAAILRTYAKKLYRIVGAAHGAAEVGRPDMAVTLLHKWGYIDLPQRVEKKVYRTKSGYSEFTKAVKDQQGNLYVSGYAVRFGVEDREGEIFRPGCLSQKVLDEYMRDPTVLLDHKNESGMAVGVTEEAKILPDGLWVLVKISNSSDDVTRMVREKILDRSLRGFSIGGLFVYQGNEIVEIKRLFEISIVAVQAVPGANFEVVRGRPETAEAV